MHGANANPAPYPNPSSRTTAVPTLKASSEAREGHEGQPAGEEHDGRLSVQPLGHAGYWRHEQQHVQRTEDHGEPALRIARPGHRLSAPRIW